MSCSVSSTPALARSVQLGVRSSAAGFRSSTLKTAMSSRTPLPKAVASVDRSGAVGGSRRSRARAEVESAVDDLIARYGSFPASAVSERVTSVGERTVRRHLSDMVKEGKLVSVPRDRSKTYRAGNLTCSFSGDC